MKKLIFVLGLALIMASSSLALTVGTEAGGVGYIGVPVGSGDVEVGLTYSNLNDGTTKTLGAMLRYRQNITEMAKTKLGWGAQVNYVKVDGGAATTNIIGLLSGEYAITDVVAIYADISLLNYQTVDTPSATSYWVLTAPVLAYTGFKIYL